MLWHVSLLVPPAQRADRARHGRARQADADHLFLDRRRHAGRRLRSPPRDARHADRPWRSRRSRSRCSPSAGLSHPWPIYALAAIGAAAGAFDSPARQSLMPTLVPRDHLPNAISLNAIMLQVAVGRRAGDRRPDHRHARRRVGVRRQRAHVRLRHRRAADDARRARARGADDSARLQRARGSRRLRLRVLLADHPLDDAARFLRDVLLVGHRAAADLRAGRSARRRAEDMAGCTRRRRSAPC